MNVAFPHHFDHRGRTAEATDERHIRDLIGQVLFTVPGERVNHPTFGSGILQLVFEPGGPALVSSTQLLVQGALQQWLGDVIELEAVDVTLEDSVLSVTVRYVVRRTRERDVAQFTRTRP